MILRCQLREEYPDFVHTGQTVWMLGVERYALQCVPDAQAYQVITGTLVLEGGARVYTFSKTR